MGEHQAINRHAGEAHDYYNTVMTFFSLISSAFSSVFYGIIVTAAIMAILYALLRSLSSTMVHTPLFYLSGPVLAILLVVQASLMIGAMQAKDAADAAEIYMNQLLENAYGTVGAQDSQRVLDMVTEKFPVIGTYLNIADFSGHDASNLASSMHDTMTDYLSSYIWHRVWWMLGIIIVACFVVMLFDKRNPTSGKPLRHARLAPRKNYDDF